MNWQEMMFGGWQPLVRTIVVGVAAYTGLIAVLRISGKRTLSKFNAFDFVVTVALGSTLATVLLSQDVSLAQGVTAFIVLLALQFAITWLSVRSTRVRELVKSEPALLFHRGDFMRSALRRERVTEEELLAAMRAAGIVALDDVFAAVLETDGTITVVRDRGSAEPSGMRTVTGYPPEPGIR